MFRQREIGKLDPALVEQFTLARHDVQIISNEKVKPVVEVKYSGDNRTLVGVATAVIVVAERISLRITQVETPPQFAVFVQGMEVPATRPEIYVTLRVDEKR